MRPGTSLENAEKFECVQPRDRIGHNGAKVMSVGPPAGPLKEFDEWGRRIYPMRTAGGILNVVQVITDLTPQYARVEALHVAWDMRIATATISDKVLKSILMHQINPKNLEHRKKVVRFYLQCKRYGMAMAALQKTIRDFNSDTEVVQDLQPILQQLRLMYAQQMLEELGLRQESGQHALVQKILDKFPTEGVSGEILQTVRQVQQQYKEFEAKRQAIDDACQALLPQVQSGPIARPWRMALREIGPGLNPETLPRMAAFLQNQNVPESRRRKSSRWPSAAGCWGPTTATTDLPTTAFGMAAAGTGGEVLDRDRRRCKRDRQLHSILAEAAAKPEVLAALAAHMTPPYPLPDSIDENIPGYLKLEIGVLPGQPDATYYVQLPPEYNPHRRYPMIVSLHGIGHDPTMQIEWWAGEHPAGGPPGRQGQAGRYGYIVIAPAWTVEHQKEYEYSAREHAVVLGCLRDACRRFAVDTDRVFLSGHMEGGDAAWDIGVSHPDLWAGVIPISAEAQENLHLLHRERPPRAVLCRAGRVGRRPHRPQRPGPGPLSEERLQHDRRRVSRPRARALPRRAVAAVRLDEPLQTELSPAARAGRVARTGIRLHHDAAQRQLLLVGGNREPAAELHRDGLDDSHEAKPFMTGSGLTAPSGGGICRVCRFPAACFRCWCGATCRPTTPWSSRRAIRGPRSGSRRRSSTSMPASTSRSAAAGPTACRR